MRRCGCRGLTRSGFGWVGLGTGAARSKELAFERKRGDDMTTEHLSDAEYEAEIAHAGRMALIYRFGPDKDEIAHFPVWKKVIFRVLPVRHRWRLSWAVEPIKEYLARVGPR